MNRSNFGVFLIVLLMLPVLYLAGLLLRAGSTQVALQGGAPVIGLQTPVRVTATNPHGVRLFRAWLDQGGKQYSLFEKAEPAKRWSLFPKAVAPVAFDFDAGAKRAPGLRDGKAQLVMEATSNDLRSRTDTVRLDVEVNTQPPSVSVDDAQRYLTVGGSGVVVFSAGGYWTESGVRVGKTAFRSYPLPGSGSKNRRVCFFAMPYDMAGDVAPMVFVRNPTGAEATSSFRQETKRKKFRHREIEISDAFLSKVLAELDPAGTGRNVVDRFRKVNGTLRVENAGTLAELSTKSADRILWNGAFLQLANSAVEAQFCDYRSYKYHKEKIDEQVHLGFDLATTAKAPVTASNDGQVLYAAPLGIYGNAIVIDHGLGLQTLYAHLSEFKVKVGDAVKKGQTIGRSGATGLAGGDHLHFTTLISGVPVNPVEWWDGHWIQDRVQAQLAVK